VPSGSIFTQAIHPHHSEEFRKMENKKELYSYHTFMLPFTFKKEFYPNENWQLKDFEIKNPKDYNEFVYFYKHVQDALFNQKNGANISRYYVYTKEKGTYTINREKGEFILELDSISLRIFDTNVAILSFNLKNTRYVDIDSILAINDFGRRIYPQFLGKNFTADTKQVFLANCITLSFDDKTIWSENFTRFDTFEGMKEQQLLPKFISELIENNFEKDKENKTTIRPIIDDRMFAISQYHNDEIVNKLKIFKDTQQYEYEVNDFWYKYLFIDGDDKTCQSKHMTKKLIAESTYDRWVEWGTLFGISRYSFVALTCSQYGKTILLPHMQTIYFQIFSLLLAYRATIIKFGDEIQDATSDDQTITEKSKEVYKKYLKFLNKLYFKEVTAQEQGIELYNKAIKIMDIEKYMNDLDHEINELHNYVSILEEQKRNKKLDTISRLGLIFLPATFVTGFLGMNYLTGIGKYLPNCMLENQGIVSSILVFCAFVFGLIIAKAKTK